MIISANLSFDYSSKCKFNPIQPEFNPIFVSLCQNGLQKADETF